MLWVMSLISALNGTPIWTGCILMDLNNIYGDYLVKRRVTMMLQFVYKGDYTLAVQLYHNHALLWP